MCSKYARCISQVSEKHNVSSIFYSHFTDLHEILYTFQQHSIHLDTLTNFRFICLGSSLIKSRKYSVFSEFMKEFLRDFIAYAEQNISHCLTKLASSQLRRLEDKCFAPSNLKACAQCHLNNKPPSVAEKRGKPYGPQKI